MTQFTSGYEQSPECSCIRSAAKIYVISQEILRCWVPLALRGTEEITMMIKTYLDSLGKKTVFKGNFHLSDAGKIGICLRKPGVLTKVQAETLNLEENSG